MNDVHPEPGVTTDLEHGVPGDAEPYPGDEPDEPTAPEED